VCHFSRRSARSRFHRLAKSAEVHWEDHKFIYLAATRLDPAAAGARVLARPDDRADRSPSSCADRSAASGIAASASATANRIGGRGASGDSFRAERDRPRNRRWSATHSGARRRLYLVSCSCYVPELSRFTLRNDCSQTESRQFEFVLWMILAAVNRVQPQVKI
jgi:hypothetical protein